jgi:hypothetical protein
MASVLVSLLAVGSLVEAYLPSKTIGYSFKNFETKLANMGSDELVRPDDEDSPEFREYLKALLKMQANRSKQGFGAPSSGSSDAYIAKLTRMKIERNALIRAGLPDDNVDSTYQEVDYQLAKGEMAEPMIRSADQAGSVTSKGGTEVRTIDSIAERKVREAQEGGAKPTSKEMFVPSSNQNNKYAEARQLASQQKGMDQEDVNMIEKILARKKTRLSGTNHDPFEEQRDIKMPSDVASEMPDIASIQKQLDEGDEEINFDPTPITLDSEPEPVLAARVVNSAAMATPAPVAQPASVPVPVQAAAVAAQPPKERPAPAGANQRSAAVSQVDQLTTAQMEQIGRAVQGLVKHRGGGPFGKGRLVGREASELVGDLEAALSIVKATNGAVPTSSAPASSAAPVVPAVHTTPVAPATPVPAPAPAPAPVQSASQLATTESLSSREIAMERPPTIAQGLDHFLTAPQDLGPEQLGDLRDGLIQVLGMVAAEAAQRMTGLPRAVPVAQPPSPEASEIPAPGSRLSPLVPEGTSIEAEVKQTLGLLLKHRGGPGFGHGRLDGAELMRMENNLAHLTERLAAEATA